MKKRISNILTGVFLAVVLGLYVLGKLANGGF